MATTIKPPLRSVRTGTMGVASNSIRAASSASRLVHIALSGFLFCFLSLVAWSTQVAASIIESRESQYNSIFILQDSNYVSMLFGHNRRLYTESSVNTKDPLELPAEYTRFMTAALAYRPDTNKILEIGLGGGSTAWYLHRTFPQLQVIAVELDPVVAELAQKYFFVRPNEKLRIVVQDGRLFLVKTDEKYDVVLIDAYRGPFVPFHLLTREFFMKVKERLAPNGVVAQNVEPTTILYDSALATISSVFDNVDVYRASGNFVVVAYDGPRKSTDELEKRAREIDEANRPRYPLAELVRQRSLADNRGGKVLTDDFAPVEMLNATQRYNRRLAE